MAVSRIWLNEYVKFAHESFLQKLHDDLTADFERRFQKKFDGTRTVLVMRERTYHDTVIPDFGRAIIDVLLILGNDVFLAGILEWSDHEEPIAVRFGEDISDKNVTFRIGEVDMFDPSLLDDLGTETTFVDLGEALGIRSRFPVLSLARGLGLEYHLNVTMKEEQVEPLLDYFDTFIDDWNTKDPSQLLKAVFFSRYEEEEGFGIYSFDSFRAEGGQYFIEMIEGIPQEISIERIEVI